MVIDLSLISQNMSGCVWRQGGLQETFPSKNSDEGPLEPQGPCLQRGHCSPLGFGVLIGKVTSCSSAALGQGSGKCRRTNLLQWLLQALPQVV